MDAQVTTWPCHVKVEHKWFEEGKTVDTHMSEVARIDGPAPNDWDGFCMWTSPDEDYKLGRISFNRCPGGWTETIELLEPKPGMDYYMFKKYDPRRTQVPQ